MRYSREIILKFLLLIAFFCFIQHSNISSRSYDSEDENVSRKHARMASSLYPKASIYSKADIQEQVRVKWKYFREGFNSWHQLGCFKIMKIFLLLFTLRFKVLFIGTAIEYSWTAKTWWHFWMLVFSWSSLAIIFSCLYWS